MESKTGHNSDSRIKYWLIFIGIVMLIIILALILIHLFRPEKYPDYYSDDQIELLEEHVYGGLPGEENLYFRRGYILSYDEEHRVPRWVAYHIIPDYLNTPERDGRFENYRTDPEIQYPVDPDDYKGLHGSELNLARGHLAPYAVMGGDRDGDGQYAADSDEYDIQTVLECNYMSNMAPQNHRNFNGSGGLWFMLERQIQDKLVEARGEEVWVFAGCVFDQTEPIYVGPAQDIAVPPMFFKIVIRESPDTDDPEVLAFLFPHQFERRGEIRDFLTSIDSIEALTNLDFFRWLSDKDERKLENTDTRGNWENIFKP